MLARNYITATPSCRVYEFAKVYNKRPDGLADEPKVLTLGAYGEDMDFYALKGAVEEICDALRIKDAEFVPVRDNPSYHPGRCAALLLGGEKCGVFGQIHPLAAANYGVSAPALRRGAELPRALRPPHDRALLHPAAPLPRRRARYLPRLRRRAHGRRAREMHLRRGRGEYLESVEVFDVYKGAGIPEGRKSISFSLTLRASDQTLTDAHADEAVQAILTALEDRYKRKTPPAVPGDNASLRVGN